MWLYVYVGVSMLVGRISGMACMQAVRQDGRHASKFAGMQVGR